MGELIVNGDVSKTTEKEVENKADIANGEAEVNEFV